jgi:hypothetical protein
MEQAVDQVPFQNDGRRNQEVDIILDIAAVPVSNSCLLRVDCCVRCAAFVVLIIVRTRTTSCCVTKLVPLAFRKKDLLRHHHSPSFTVSFVRFGNAGEYSPSDFPLICPPAFESS